MEEKNPVVEEETCHLWWKDEDFGDFLVCDECCAWMVYDEYEIPDRCPSCGRKAVEW